MVINLVTFDSSEKISSYMQQFQTLGIHCLNIKISRIMKYSCDQNLSDIFNKKSPCNTVITFKGYLVCLLLGGTEPREQPELCQLFMYFVVFLYRPIYRPFAICTNSKKIRSICFSNFG